MKAFFDSTLFTRIGLGLLAHLERHPQHPGQEFAADIRAGAGGRVVLVSSAHPGEGKSFVAQGLARALADQQGDDVVCVDAAFDTVAADGDASYHGAAGLSEIMTLGSLQGLTAGADEDRLWRLGRGVLAQRPLLYRPEAVRQGLSALRAGFALTVLDGPCLDACGALVDQVDACVLVVDARHTSRYAAQHALAQAHFGPARMAGVVLNHRPRPVPRWLGGD